MLNSLFKSLYYRIKNYNKEIMGIKFNEFNRFIVTVLLKQITRTDVILPAAIGFIVILLSFQSLTQDSIFFPQSNVPAYVTFLLFQFAIAIATIYVFPLITIILLNAIFSLFDSFNTKALQVIKVIVTIIIYYLILKLFNSYDIYHIKDYSYIISLWLLMYISCVNMFISYTKHRSLTKFTKLRLLILAVFVFLSVKPIGNLLINTSQASDFVRINRDTILPNTNCEEMMRSDTAIASSNYILNDKNYYESNSTNCILHKNVYRTGFSSDYVIVVRKNIEPIQESDNLFYSYYTRIACYSGNCFIDNDIKKNIKHDEYTTLIPYPEELSKIKSK